MAVPLDPTVTSIVTQGLRRGGRVNPSLAQITEATDHALQEVKADIMLKAETHPSLLATSTTVVTKGQQRYSTPPDYNIPYSISLLNGPEDLKGAAQSGSLTSIVLSASTQAQADDLIGKYILITSGPGVEEYRQILAYDTGTKQVTVDLNWDVIPTSTSTYAVITSIEQLWPSTTAELDITGVGTSLGLPMTASIFAQEYILYPIPDKSTYGLQSRYWSDLSKLDEAEALFIQLLREWRNIWIQGIAVKTMQRFDEDRYISELQIYNAMLDMLASKAASVGQVVFNDL